MIVAFKMTCLKWKKVGQSLTCTPYSVMLETNATYCVFSLEIPSGLYSSLPVADVYCELCWKYITVSKADESMMI